MRPISALQWQQGWMSGYTDGSFRPNQTVTLEEACTAALTLLGYDVTTLTGGFPGSTAEQGKRHRTACKSEPHPGQAMTMEDGAILLYNALTANTASGSVYGTTLGFTVTNGQVDVSSILLSNLEGPFVASEGESLPFEPEAVYCNDSVSTNAQLSAYDVYYYNASAKTVWVYTRKAAGRITAVSPSAQRTHICYRGWHQLHHCKLLGSSPAVQPERRRRGSGSHPAAGHEQRSRCRADR